LPYFFSYFSHVVVGRGCVQWADKWPGNAVPTCVKRAEGAELLDRSCSRRGGGDACGRLRERSAHEAGYETAAAGIPAPVTSVVTTGNRTQPSSHRC
jgi:hypothetical protein